MKKIYVKPQTEVIIQETCNSLLAGSPTGTEVPGGNADPGNETLAPDMLWDDWTSDQVTTTH